MQTAEEHRQKVVLSAMLLHFILSLNSYRRAYGFQAGSSALALSKLTSWNFRWVAKSFR